MDLLKNKRNMENLSCKENEAGMRQSNFELLRLLAMFLIIASHWGWAFLGEDTFYPYDVEGYGFSFLFYKVFRSFGQVGVTLFILISGYFLVKSRFKSKSFIRLVFENIFYSLLIFACASIVIPKIEGETFFTMSGLMSIFRIFSSNYWFIACYYVMMLLSPFINLMLEKLTSKQYLLLLAILFYFIIALPTLNVQLLGDNTILYNTLFFAFIYLVGGFMRLFPNCFKNNLIALVGILLCLTINVGSLFLNVLIFEARNSYICFFIALFTFILFKNIHFKSKFINIIASTSLGVYILHENVFNKYIWKKLFQIPKFYTCWYFAFVSIGSVLALFAACIIIDLIRQFLLEKPLFKFLDKHCSNIFTRIDSVFPISCNTIKEDEDIKIEKYIFAVIFCLFATQVLNFMKITKLSKSLMFTLFIIILILLKFLFDKISNARIKKSTDIVE